MRKIAVLSVVALLILLAYFGSRDEGEGEGEGETSSIVDNAELALTRAGFIEISVSDEDGVVILAGTVETESEQFAVGRVARSVADVVDIDNRVTAAEAKPDETPAGAATAPALEL
ncbi:MAG: BON domain-containing protein, partial [Acidobacteria bacterium]|nr:BON domain-containing protein [Acidobacteriota bacterium]